MLKSIIHAARVVRAVVREKMKGVTRSSKWPAARDEFLKVNTKCAACGGTLHLQVHHKMPFHTNPSMELDPANFIVLCMGPNECHVHVGHGDSFHYYNPNVDPDSLEFKIHPERKQAIFDRAEAARILNEPDDEK